MTSFCDLFFLEKGFSSAFHGVSRLIGIEAFSGARPEIIAEVGSFFFNHSIGLSLATLVVRIFVVEFAALADFGVTSTFTASIGAAIVENR